MEEKSSKANVLPSVREVVQKHGKDKAVIKCWCYYALFLALALLFALVSLWCLRMEVAMLQKKAAILKSISEDIKAIANVDEILRTRLKSSVRKMSENAAEPSPHEFATPPTGDYDYDHADAGDDYEDGEYVVGGLDNSVMYGFVDKVKRKRDIGEYENADEREKLHPVGASTEKSTFESVSEITSKDKIIPSNFRLSRKHRKHRKSRIGSAERFYTETQSTTAVPVQVRRSRTKATPNHGTGLKQSWITNRMGELFDETASSGRNAMTMERGAPKDHLQDAVSGSTGLELNGSSEGTADALSYNMITIHFSADTSHYSRERDPHYFGNGRMQIKSDVYKDWKPAHWTQGLGMTKYFQLNQGRVTVFTTGIYLIYAQIQYSNVQEVNGFSVFRNSDIVVQCITTSTHPDKQEIKSNTCGISTTILLQSNDSVCIKDLHHGRYVVLTPEKSYFGLVLLSPFKK